MQVSFESASCWNINSVFTGLPTHVDVPVEKRRGYTGYKNGVQTSSKF